MVAVHPSAGPSGVDKSVPVRSVPECTGMAAPGHPPTPVRTTSSHSLTLCVFKFKGVRTPSTDEYRASYNAIRADVHKLSYL